MQVNHLSTDTVSLWRGMTSHTKNPIPAVNTVISSHPNPNLGLRFCVNAFSCARNGDPPH